MTIVVNQRHRVHFTMEGERGAFVILHHGLFGSHRDWYRAGYVEALANDFRLILPDARGHGRSDRPADPAAYSPDAFSADLLAVMNDLDIRNAHFVGYSLGALVGFDLMLRHPERVRLIMLGGESPAVTPEAQALWREAAGKVRAEGLAPWLRAEREAGRLCGVGEPDEETEREPAAALLDALAGWEVPHAESFQASSPITIFSASDDPAYERTQGAARRFPRARFIPFPGQTHRGLLESKDALLDAMLRFIKISRRPEGGREAGDEQDDRTGEERRATETGDAERESREPGDQEPSNPERESQERSGLERGGPERSGQPSSWRGQGQGQRGNERRGGRGGRNDRRGNFRRDRPWQGRPEGDWARRNQGNPQAPGTESVELSPSAESAQEAGVLVQPDPPPLEAPRGVDAELPRDMSWAGPEPAAEPEREVGAEPGRDAGTEQGDAPAEQRVASTEPGFDASAEPGDAPAAPESARPPEPPKPDGA